MVSLLLGPIVASCGAYIPMISGRGLGHTGGTLDKLDAIPGFNSFPGIEQFQQLVSEHGIAIVGQTAELASADRRIYAVRDVTATVASPPLIISSILSKKLAEGLDGLVLDIKFGSGAFTPELEDALRLARDISAVAHESGLPCNALVTDMNQPLAWSAGNALEVMETVRFLRGDARHERLESVVVALSGELLQLGGLARGRDDARSMALASLESGRAAEKFSEMVAAQGGPSTLLEQPEKFLPSARVIRPVFPDRGGFVCRIDTRAVGNAVVFLGGGRRHTEDPVNPAVGVSDIAGVASEVGEDAPLAVIHAADETGWEQAAVRLKSAFEIGHEPVDGFPVISARVEGESSHDAL